LINPLRGGSIRAEGALCDKGPTRRFKSVVWWII
jgi:hypothetical protein